MEQVCWAADDRCPHGRFANLQARAVTYRATVCRVSGLIVLAVWVDAAGPDGDGWNLHFFDGHVIAAR